MTGLFDKFELLAIINVNVLDINEEKLQALGNNKYLWPFKKSYNQESAYLLLTR